MNVDWVIEQMEGKEAPEPLLAVQAFTNTLDIEQDVDWLDSVAHAKEWLAASGLGTKKMWVTAGLLNGAVQLRTALRRALAANEKGEPDLKAANALGQLASRLQIPLKAGNDGRLEVDMTPADAPNELLAQLLGIVFQAQATGEWERLKLCQNPDCAWAFYDNSRNRSGSWCRMGLCGNRLKNRAYRERQRQSAG